MPSNKNIDKVRPRLTHQARDVPGLNFNCVRIWFICLRFGGAALASGIVIQMVNGNYGAPCFRAIADLRNANRPTFAN